MKTCCVCKIELLLTDFHLDKKSKDGHVSRCKECTKKYTREWYRNCAHKIRYRAVQLGLDPDEIEAYFNAHDGACEICGRQPRNGYQLSIDHDHATGKFRGLLCNQCNTGLGQFQDSPGVLTNAIAYLRR